MGLDHDDNIRPRFIDIIWFDYEYSCSFRISFTSHLGPPVSNIGIAIALRAMEDPLRQIVDNAGEEASVVLAKVADGEGNFGYNAASGEYGDMVQMGILDPTKVTRSALQNASSVAGLLITTECMVAELPKEEAAAPDMSGMGGMGGMM